MGASGSSISLEGPVLPERALEQLIMQRGSRRSASVCWAWSSQSVCLLPGYPNWSPLMPPIASALA